MYIYQIIGLVGKMTKETGVQSQVELYQKLDATLLNTQNYKECIKGKLEKSRAKSIALSYTWG